MNQNFSFLFGLLIGLSFTLMCFYPQKSAIILSVNSKEDLSDKTLPLTVNLYNETLAEKLYNEVRILCFVMTIPDNHKKKAIFVKKLWGSRCNKLLFFSTSADTEINSIALPVKEGRGTLWDKTKNAFQYVFKHHFNDAEWFLKADDDSYVNPENLRYMLYSYNPTAALYFGHRYAVEFGPNDFSSYMAGGGYLLSKKALEKFATKLAQNSSICSKNENGNEDWEMGRCLESSAISVDERDEDMGKRFFPAGVQEHMKPKKDPNYWYDTSQYYEVAQGNLSCCSVYPACFHYISPKEMHLIEYLTRIVYPFGLDKSSPEELPRKLKLKEILFKSDVESSSIKFRKHRIYHHLDESEKYMRRKRNS